MLTAHSVAEIRAAEARLAETTGWPELMQRAAAGLADHVEARFAPGEAILALVGPGNNGGDALYAAARLCERGRRVNLCLLDAERVHAEGLAAALAAGATIVDSPRGHRLCIDAVYGIGARPGLDAGAAEWARWQAEAGATTIAVDVPSGIGVDDGTLPGPHLVAQHTVTFGTHKVGLLAGPAADVAAERDEVPTLVDIGLAPHLAEPTVEAIEPGDGALLAESLFTDAAVHKYTRGVVMIAAGSPAYAGAAHLAVAGAQAGPAGMVRFHGAPDLAARVVDRAPEVVAGAGRVQAWVVGPGGGDDVGDQLAVASADGVPVVVDASALAHLPDRFDVPALLTPHAGELAAMLDTDRAMVEADPLGHATAAAERWAATVLLKGKRTLVVTPGRPARVNLSGTPWLGTAGSGDVLAGLAGSLLAAGLDPRDAGSIAAFLHGAAAVAANRGGPVTASAVAAAIPGVTAAFLAGRLEEVRIW